MTRRHFMQTSAGVLAAAAALPTLAADSNAPDLKGRKIRLGMDNFAVRKMGWKGRELVDYAVGLKLDTLFITDLPSLGTLEVHGVSELRKYADDKGLALQVGSWSVCPTSTVFKKDWGTAEEHIALGLRLSKAAGSPAFRAVLGTREDRKTPGGIEARIADTAKALQSQRHLAQDLGVKIAIENHAGDMTANELLTLLDAAGKDFVGVNLDSGNALWTLEDPIESLEKLGPYTLTTSLRDGRVWETEKGCKIQWTAMGDGGCVDLKEYFTRYAQICPDVAVNIETIGGFVAEFPYLEAGFWQGFPKKSAAEFAKFLSLAKKGKAIAQYNADDGQRQQDELAKSIRYCREVLGLGVRT